MILKNYISLIITLLCCFQSAKASFTVDNISYITDNINGSSEYEVLVNNICATYGVNSEFVIPDYVYYLNNYYKVTGINNFACKNNTSLTYVGIPATAKFIGGGAFWGCTSLTYCTIAEGVTQILPAAFYGCTSLKEIEIPASAALIAGRADDVSRSHFYNCGLETVKVHYQHPNIIDDNTFEGSYKRATLYVPVGTKYLYQNTSGWKLFENIIEDVNMGTYFMIDVVCGENGIVEFLEKTASAGNNVIWNVAPNEDILFSIFPNEDYMVDKVYLNGTDITTDVIENILTIKNVENDLKLEVTFKNASSTEVNTIDADKDQFIEIYTPTGIKVYSGKCIEYPQIGLTHGLYIIKDLKTNSTRKIAIN